MISIQNAAHENAPKAVKLQTNARNFYVSWVGTM